MCSGFVSAIAGTNTDESMGIGLLCLLCVVCCVGGGVCDVLLSVCCVLCRWRRMCCAGHCLLCVV